jgi:hypothetical protein
MMFQNDGALPHFRQIMGFLKQSIDHAGSVTWPPKYWDLTPLDVFIWYLERYFLQHEYTDESGNLCRIMDADADMLEYPQLV